MHATPGDQEGHWNFTKIISSLGR